MTSFADHDQIFGGEGRRFIDDVPGAKGQSHTIISGAGHFTQEDTSPEWARLLVEFTARTS